MKLLFHVLMLVSLGTAAQTNIYDYKLSEVRPGVYVSVRDEPLRQTVEGNFVLIINDTDVVVVDAGGSPKAARNAISDLKKITSKPVTYLVNSHFHGDHTFGNQEYKKQFPGLEILSTRETRDVMLAREKSFKFYLLNADYFEGRRKYADSVIKELSGADPVHNKKIIENYVRYRDFDLFQLRELYGEVKITPPTLAFEKEMTLYRGKRRIEIFHPGAGDTPGDAWVFLPAEKILITGDAVVHPVPYGFSKSPVEWVNSLEKVTALDFEILVPGHGEVQYGKAYLLQLIELLKACIEQVRQLVAENNSREEVRKMLDISVHEAKFTRNDPFHAYYFKEYFKDPIIETLISHFFDVKK
jgi:glyoxylase-like metal-dependent hydrolase (beta-lactamase superfamily II)